MIGTIGPLDRSVLSLALVAFAASVLALPPGQCSTIKSAKEICAEARAAVAHLEPAELQTRLTAQQPCALLDIRTRAEYEAGHIAGAIWLPRGFLEFKIQNLVPDPATPIVVYCLKGCRGSAAAATLMQMGYQDVRDLEGGLQLWLEEGLPLRNQYGEVRVTGLLDEDPYVPLRD